MQKLKLEFFDDPNFSARETELNLEYRQALHVENNMIKEKTRLKWELDGDRNSSFYHASLKAKNNKDNILSAHDQDGSLHTSSVKINESLLSYFEKLLQMIKTSSLGLKSLTVTIFLTLSIDFKNALSSIITDIEIKQAFFDMNRNSYGGPDGYNVFFFIACWDFIHFDVCKSIHNFFNKCTMLSFMNATKIALIPKVKNANSITSFRPISCCNVVYKAIAKTMAFMLKSVIPSINITQSSYLPTI